MKIINEDQAKKYNVARRNFNPVYAELRKLTVGQALVLPKAEWLPKSSPHMSVNANFRDGKKFSVNKIEEPDGWLISRVK